jgi:NADH-quinone oxidoreductase subunit N
MLLRIFLEGLSSMSEYWQLLFYVLAILTMTIGNVAALTQSNLKRMLAYSSIAHAGYLLIGVVVGTERGITAMLVYLVVYSFMQLGAFAVIVLMRRKDAIGDDLKDLSGLAFRNRSRRSRCSSSCCRSAAFRRPPGSWASSGCSAPPSREAITGWR